LSFSAWFMVRVGNREEGTQDVGISRYVKC
jgi:hypothetical protein